DLIHKCSRLRVAPLEYPRRKIRTGEDNVVIIHGNTNVISRRNQSGGWRKFVLDYLHRNVVVSALRGQVIEKVLQHVVLEGHTSACTGNRVKGPAVPLVYFLD